MTIQWYFRFVEYIYMTLVSKGGVILGLNPCRFRRFLTPLTLFGDIFRFTHHTTLIFSPSKSLRLNGPFRYPHHDVSTENKNFCGDPKKNFWKNFLLFFCKKLKKSEKNLKILKKIGKNRKKFQIFFFRIGTKKNFSVETSWCGYPKGPLNLKG